MNWTTLAILVPLMSGILGFIFWKNRRLQVWIGLIGMGLLTIVSFALMAQISRDGIQTVALGTWSGPFGIVLVADMLSAIMLVISALVGLCALVYALADLDEKRIHFGFFPFTHFMMAGVCGSFLTADLFNLFVWFEVMLISSFVLMTLGGERPQMEGAVKYVIINLVSSAFFLTAIGILYGTVGTLNLADLSVKLSESGQTGLISLTAILFIVAFGVKGGIFPLFFWLPASYHTPPVAVSALFSGLLTKVGVYALIRLFSLVYNQDLAFTHTVLLILAAFTMLTGIFGAMIQFEVRRLLSFHIISQIGYMILGLAIFTPAAIAGAIFYLFHNNLVKTNLFFISGIMQRHCGTFQLKKMGGLYLRAPWLAVFFFIPAMSLAGIPPLSGFFAKLAVAKAGLDAGTYFVVGIALFVGLFTLFSMTKIWAEAFWKTAPSSNNHPSDPALVNPATRWILHAPVILLVAVTLFVSFYPEALMRLCMTAADQLLDPSEYIDKVLQTVR